MAVAPGAPLTAGDRFLARLGIRPDDKTPTSLMFSNMFMSGIGIGMIRVCAFTLFLNYWAAEQLALIAILIAAVGMPMTLLIDRLTHRFAVRNYLFTIIGIILVGLITMRLLLGVSLVCSLWRCFPGCSMCDKPNDSLGSPVQVNFWRRWRGDSSWSCCLSLSRCKIF